jgi:protein O-mannosyl-transferase
VESFLRLVLLSTKRNILLTEKKSLLLSVAVVAAIICFVVYLRALSCEFVNWEDQDYILNNQGIRTLDRNFFVWAFTTTPVNSFWLPLTYLSLALDYHFWELNPLGFHLTNILLHAINTGLVVFIADALFRKIFAGKQQLLQHRLLYPGMLLLAALLFGIHPSKVEAVAWVAERKAVLNGLFTMTSILCYLRYVHHLENNSAKTAVYRNYMFSLLLLLLSLMAKPTSITMAGMLLVLDWYPLKRLNQGKILRVLTEKVPYLLLSLAVISVTVLSHSKTEGFNTLSELPLGIRAIAAGNAVFEYFKLMLFPVGILPYYDLPRQIPQVFIVKAVVVVILLSGIIFWRRKAPPLAALTLSFVIPLIPTLHFFAGGAQVIITSRYAYLSSLVPSIIVAAMVFAGYEKVALSWRRFGRFAVAGLLVSLLAFYALETQRLIGVWHDSGTMWSRVIDHGAFDRAYFYRALYYVDSGNYAAAVKDYSTSLEIELRSGREDIFNLHAFRAEALIKAGRYEEAVNDLTLAIQQFPHRLYYYHRGLALQGLGRLGEADGDFRRAGRAKGQMYWFSPGASLD